MAYLGEKIKFIKLNNKECICPKLSEGWSSEDQTENIIYSTVTDLARLRGLSGSSPFKTAI